MSAIQTAQTVTIANGQTTSNAIDLGELAVVGIQTPSALTGTSFTFQASSDNVTFCAVTKVDGTTYTMTVAASKYIVVPPADLAGVRYLKIVSGATEGQADTIIVVTRQV